MANKIYAAPETALKFTDSGGDAVITLNVSPLALGASPRSTTVAPVASLRCMSGGR